jgi:BolA protein
MNNAERLTAIRDRLTTALSPQQLEVIDESQHHAGHAGASTGMGHYAVSIQSPLFAGKSLVEAHRLIYQALGEMMETDIHALKISILS